MCDHHHPPRSSSAKAKTSHRHGARLEDGSAHSKDHSRWSRRDFLTRMGLASVGASFAINASPVVAYGQTPLLQQIALSGTNRVLVLIQLNGGNDGLNTVIPVENSIYYNKRPTIAIPKSSAFLLDNETGLHPAMSGLESLWGDGDMAVIHNVGYSSQTRSHFEGTINWSTARDQGQEENTGWLARYLVDGNPELFLNPVDYPLAVRVGGPAALFQSASGNLSVTFGDAQEFETFVNQGGFYDVQNVPDTVYGQELAYVRSVTNASFRYVESVQNAASGGTNLGEYGNSGLSNSLAVVARMLRGGLNTHLYTVSRGGFDTHSNQGGTEGSHANMLGDVATSVAAFLDDLKQDGLDQRVLVMTFSEFGRTLEENGSRGTDHGAGAPMMLFGSGLNGGLFGTQSDLQDLYGGDPRFSTDYRSVYASVLQDWFGIHEPDVDGILDGSYSRLDVIQDKIQVSNETLETPRAVGLSQNYPNPFNPETTIDYEISESGQVSLKVFDLRGREIRTVVNEFHSPGRYSRRFDAGNLPNGTYLYQLKTPAGSHTRKMILMK